MTFDFKRLYQETVHKYRTETAERCFFLHRWTRWSTDADQWAQRRSCTKCGKLTIRKLPSVRCSHDWETEDDGWITTGPNDRKTGRYFVDKCTRCGEIATRKAKIID